MGFCLWWWNRISSDFLLGLWVEVVKSKSSVIMWRLALILSYARVVFGRCLGNMIFSFLCKSLFFLFLSCIDFDHCLLFLHLFWMSQLAVIHFVKCWLCWKCIFLELNLTAKMLFISSVKIMSFIFSTYNILALLTL